MHQQILQKIFDQITEKEFLAESNDVEKFRDKLLNAIKKRYTLSKGINDLLKVKSMIFKTQPSKLCGIHKLP